MATTSGSEFLNRQINTYGMPRITTTSPYMPNGAPQPQPSGGTGTVGTVNKQGVYSGGQAPTATYQQQAIPQFQAPNTGQIGQQTQGLVSQIMSNPYTLSPQVLSQMKGQNRDQAALLEKQTMGNLLSQMAGRGIDPRSNYALAQQRALQAGTNSDILSANRGMDIQAALQNRQDLYNAANLGGQYENDALQRAIGGYGATLQGLGMQGQEQQSYLDSILRNYQSGLQGAQLQSSSQLGAVGNQLQQRGQDLQNSQFGLNLDLQRDQMAQQAAMQRRSLGQSASQFDQQMAFQYQQAQQREFENLLQYLMSGGS